MEETLLIRRLGRRDYCDTWRAMQTFTDARDAHTPDELWLVEHPPVFTQGLAGKAEHLLSPGDIPVVHCDRGGQVTYHGPGQLVAYLLLNLARKRLSPRQFVQALQCAVVSLLEDHGIAGTPRPEAPGVYVGEAKICSIGLRVRKGCTYHGLALNVDMDLAPFSRINPCGFKGMAMTQVSAFVAGATIEDVSPGLCRHLVRALGYNNEETMKNGNPHVE